LIRRKRMKGVKVWLGLTSKKVKQLLYCDEKRKKKKEKMKQKVKVKTERQQRDDLGSKNGRRENKVSQREDLDLRQTWFTVSKNF